MCGIVGFLDRTGDESAPVGKTILDMISALSCRGPDSAGVALYGGHRDGDFVIKAMLGENGDYEETGARIAERVKDLGPVGETALTDQYLRIVMDYAGDPRELETLILSASEEVEVLSLGRRLEISKDVGSPQNLENTSSISNFLGTHGIGHTRLSTESRVDISHSQPFWAHGYPDLAIVHNGHITNYHLMRNRYEHQGVRFYTENDSEIIGVYLAEQLTKGMTLEEALHASLTDLDGSFSYLATTADSLGFAKDPFAFKPLLFAEAENYVAVATEEIAIRSAFEATSSVREAQAKEVRVWQR